jgi:ABC-type Na+ efflux pump permease subunit
MEKKNNTKVVTGTVRLSYEHVWEPASINGGEEKYSASLIIPKSDNSTINKPNNEKQQNRSRNNEFASKQRELRNLH